MKYKNKSWLSDKYVKERLNTYEIADMCECSDATIGRWLKKHGIPARSLSKSSTLSNAKKFGHRRYRNENWLEIQYVNKSRKLEDIALDCGVSYQTISRWLSRFGIPLRTRTESASMFRCGENHHNWKGGITHLHERIRGISEYTQWRNSVFERDDFTCQHCNQRGGELQADHEYPLSEIISDENISSLKQARCCDILWDVSNGRTLCVDCHRKTDTFGGKLRSKLDKDQVKEIANYLCVTKKSHAQIAELFNVSRTLICSINTGSSWITVTSRLDLFDSYPLRDDI